MEKTETWNAKRKEIPVIFEGVDEFEARRVEGLRSLTFFAGGRPYLLSREREVEQLVSRILSFIDNRNSYKVYETNKELS